MKRLALIAAAGLSLTGCGWIQPPGSSPTRRHYPVVVHFPTVVAGHVMIPVLREPAQLVSPTWLGIVTLGSSSCPSVPDELVVESPHSLTLHLTVGSWSGPRDITAHPPPGGVCTADYGSTTMLVAIDPEEIDVHEPLTVRFSGSGAKARVVTVAPLKS